MNRDQVKNQFNSNTAQGGIGVNETGIISLFMLFGWLHWNLWFYYCTVCL